MNYDLQLLANYVSSRTTSKVIVAFQDSEAFDSGLLAEMLDLFRYAQITLRMGVH
jgi:origin recognition complex subunit 3